MYRLLYIIMLFGFFVTLVEDRLLNKYDPDSCTFKVNKHGAGDEYFDLSSMVGVIKLINITMGASIYKEDSLDDTSCPENTTTIVNVYLCSYMRERDKMSCGDVKLSPPSVCVIIYNSKGEPLYYDLPIMSEVTLFGEKTLSISFETDKGAGSVFNVDLVVDHSSDNSTNFNCKNRNHYVVEWSSSNFIPATVVSQNNSCQVDIKTPQGSHVFDILGLMESQYLLNDENLSATLNCSNLILHSPSSETTVKTFDSSQLTYSSHKGLSIKYRLNKNGSYYYQFNLICISGLTSPRIKVLNKNLNIFALYSSVPCYKYPLGTDNTAALCQIEKGRDGVRVRYSWESLSTNSVNYELPLLDGSKLIFNVCRQLRATARQTFTGGDIFAVVYNETTKEVINLGVEQLSPVFQNGSIIIKFGGGDICSSGNYSLEIQLICNRIKSFDPQSVPSGSYCLYKIKWETMTACPYIYHEFSNCALEETDVPHFNLSTLRKAKDYEVSNPHGTLLINACGPLVSHPQASAAFSSSDKNVLIFGSEKRKIEMRDGVITYDMYGDPCRTGVHFSRMKVQFECRNESLIELLVYKPEDCLYSVKWLTQEACYPPAQYNFNCSVLSDRASYNLTGLAGKVFSVSNEKETVHLTICSNLSGPAAVLCSRSSTACWLHNNSEGDYRATGFSILQEDDGFIVTDFGKLILKYSSEVKCSNYTVYSLQLEFDCSPDILESKVELVYSSDPCHLKAKIKSPLACSSSKDITTDYRTTPQANSCRTSKEPIIDLIHLRGHVWEFQSKLKVSICTPLKDYHEGAILKEDKKWVGIGKVSEILLYKPRLPYLNYSGSGHLTTLISFPCDRSSEPIKSFNKLDDSTYSVTWPTAAACLQQLQYQPAHDEACQLDMLNDFLRVYNVTLNEKSYLLVGLCKSLPPECLEDSAACVVENKNSQLHYTSVGYATGKVVADHFDNIIIKMTDGAMCSRDGLQYNTIVKLICVHSSSENGQSIKYIKETCSYLLEIRNNKLCPRTDPVRTTYDEKLPIEREKNREEEYVTRKIKEWRRQMSESSISKEMCSSSSPVSCLIDNLNHVKSLRVVGGVRERYLLEFNFKGKGLETTVCPASICHYELDSWAPVALFHNLTHLSMNNTYKLEYQAIRPNLNPMCSGFSGAEMFLTCREDTSTSYNPEPVIKWENECTFGIEWMTDLACITSSHTSATSNTLGYNWTMICFTVFSILFPCIIFFLIWRKKLGRLLLHCCRQNHTLPRGYCISSASVSSTEETRVLFSRPGYEDSRI